MYKETQLYSPRCKLGLNSVVKDLIEKGSDVDRANIFKNTALIEAAANNQALCIDDTG